MADLSNEEILVLARAGGATIPDSLITEVGYSLNGLLEALDLIDTPGLDEIEPLPIVIPSSSTPGGR